jgi:hypothetical protein
LAKSRKFFFGMIKDEDVRNRAEEIGWATANAVGAVTDSTKGAVYAVAKGTIDTVAKTNSATRLVKRYSTKLAEGALANVRVAGGLLSGGGRAEDDGYPRNSDLHDPSYRGDYEFEPAPTIFVEDYLTQTDEDMYCSFYCFDGDDSDGSEG